MSIRGLTLTNIGGKTYQPSTVPQCLVLDRKKRLHDSYREFCLCGSTDNLAAMQNRLEGQSPITHSTLQSLVDFIIYRANNCGLKTTIFGIGNYVHFEKLHLLIVNQSEKNGMKDVENEGLSSSSVIGFDLRKHCRFVSLLDEASHFATILKESDYYLCGKMNFADVVVCSSDTDETDLEKYFDRNIICTATGWWLRTSNTKLSERKEIVLVSSSKLLNEALQEIVNKEGSEHTMKIASTNMLQDDYDIGSMTSVFQQEASFLEENTKQLSAD